MRSFLALAFLPLMFVACGPQEGDFLVQYNTALCKHTMACSDQATLTFDGIVTQEDCEAARITDVQLWGAGCRYVAATASQCLLDMDALKCPATAGTLADRPASCDLIYTDCPAGTEDTTPAQDTDAGAGDDTDAATP